MLAYRGKFLTENSDDSLKNLPLQMNLTRTLPHLLLLSPRFQKIKTTLPPLQIRQIHQNLLVPHPQFIHQVPLVPAALKISLISFRDWITANLTLTILLLTAYQQSSESYSSFQTRSSFQLILLPLHSWLVQSSNSLSKYYSHQHYIQGQGKLIWANIEKLSKLNRYW